jgi:hypothetical protein
MMCWTRCRPLCDEDLYCRRPRSFRPQFAQLDHEILLQSAKGPGTIILSRDRDKPGILFHVTFDVFENVTDEIAVDGSPRRRSA